MSDPLRRAAGRLRRVAGRVRRGITPGGAPENAPAAAPTPPPPPLPLVGYVVAGGGGAHPASAHVRVVRRTEQLAASGTAEVHQVDPETFVDGSDERPYVAVLVQRDILPVASVAPFLAAAADRGVPVVAEVDDDFFTASGRDRLARAEYDPDRLASIDALVRGADVVVVSTPELADVVRPIARDVVVVANALDPTLWVPEPADSTPDTAAQPDDGGPEHRVLYMGTLTHAADLELLRDVFDDLTAPDGTPIRLEVIGVTEDDGPDWYRRVEVPDGHYPAFARWLVDHRTRWRAGVAPLRDEEFNRAKSDLKFLEYTALGLPAVVSDRPSYRLAGEHGAVLVPDDVAAWRDAVRTAVESGRAPERATRWVTSERTLGADGDAWSRVLLGERHHRPGGTVQHR
ncbi:glycosyltransferase involved in cell wall biosynthesis [Curtobacterium sp. PhB130]|uniref:glycosyltransferase n=1 Tax=Curtobacterium sp. PhB130 TaxID=2485178 RepID=UPI000FBBA532|nr:glycosyltransferase [Curtobacterium sp. PhB130]ROS76372.1 glycosyltransferase involved in cell wall biosynthesis [Curtobacterium sp. PhB130]